MFQQSQLIILLMKESRISELLLHSRSRHERIDNPQLRRISREWQKQKQASLESENDFKKLLRELRYYEQLNDRLQKQLGRGKKKIKFAESIRQRYQKDLLQKQELERLRIEEKLKNQQIAAKIKEDRNKRDRAVQRDIYAKMSLADASRCESRHLRQLRQQSRFEDYIKNRNRVEEVVQFETDLRTSAVRRKESEALAHIQRHRVSIDRERETIHSRGTRSVQLRKKLRALTEQHSGKLKMLESMQNYLDRYKSPYSPLFREKRIESLGMRCATEKQSIDKNEQSVLMLSQPSDI